MVVINTLLPAFLLGGIVAYVLARIALAILNTQDGIPVQLRFLLAFIMFALGEGLSFLFTDGGNFAVTVAYTVGFMAVFFSYDMVFTGRDKK